MLNIMTCEDDVEDARRLEQALSACRVLRGVDYSVESFRTADQLLLNFDASECDILFLDILMNGDNGIDLARRIREKDSDIPIVFVTSSRDYAVESYDVDAAHYLMKPVTPDAINAALTRCRQVIASKHRSIEFVSGRTVERVLVRDVIYAESFRNRAPIHLAKRDIDTAVSLGKVLEDGGRSFLRCHRSFVVNMTHIAHIEDKSFVMDNGAVVPIRTNGASKVIEEYRSYLFESVRSL